MQQGTRENPFTHATNPSRERQHQHCKCAICSIVASCEPNFDFYVEDGDGESDGEPLVCQSCFVSRLPDRVPAGQYAMKTPLDDGPPTLLARGRKGSS